jgi:hypothetical protein
LQAFLLLLVSAVADTHAMAVVSTFAGFPSGFPVSEIRQAQKIVAKKSRKVSRNFATFL